MTGQDTNQSSLNIEENFDFQIIRVSSSSFSLSVNVNNEMKEMNYHPIENEIKGPYKLLPSNSLEKEKVRGGNLERFILKHQLEKEDSMNISSMINSYDTWHLNLMFEDSSEASSSNSNILSSLSPLQMEFEVDFNDNMNINNNALNFVLSDEEEVLEEDIKEILLSLH